MVDRDTVIRRSCAVALACLLVTVLAGPNPAARAAPLSPPPTFTVNSIADVEAAAPLDNGVCQTGPDNTTCTLRAAITKANNYAGGGVSIILPPHTGGAKYALTIGQLTITNIMTITGGGAANTIIDGSGITPTNRVLNIGSPAIATISGVTIQGGQAVGAALAGAGGGIYISGSSALTLHDSVVTGNHAQFGGGVFNESGALTVTDSIVSNNSADKSGGGIYDGGVTVLRRVTVSSNTAVAGGGVANFGNNLLNIVDSTISDNNANTTSGPGQGGGIYNAGSSLAVVNSTISNNFSDVDGGGIYNDNNATTKLYNATIAGNLASFALIVGSGGGIFNNGGIFWLQNTLLDGNVRSVQDAQDVADDCSGTVTSLGYNLFSTTSGCTISGGTNDVKDVPGQTGPLQNNGGQTRTNALLPGSPAIDAGNPVACTDNLGTTLHTDQRGAPRPADGAGSTICDIGAFELQRFLDLPLMLK